MSLFKAWSWKLENKRQRGKLQNRSFVYFSSMNSYSDSKMNKKVGNNWKNCEHESWNICFHCPSSAKHCIYTSLKIFSLVFSYNSYLLVTSIHAQSKSWLQILVSLMVTSSKVSTATIVLLEKNWNVIYNETD